MLSPSNLNKNTSSVTRTTYNNPFKKKKGINKQSKKNNKFNNHVLSKSFMNKKLSSIDTLMHYN